MKLTKQRIIDRLAEIAVLAAAGNTDAVHEVKVLVHFLHNWEV